jgi:hypothetical protein
MAGADMITGPVSAREEPVVGTGLRPWRRKPSLGAVEA